MPPGWAQVPLGEIGKWVGGGTPSKSEARFWAGGTVPWVSPKDMKSTVLRDTEDHITPVALEESTTQIVPSCSVLIVMRSGILRHSLPVAVNAVPVALNQDLKAITPHPGIDATYLAWVLRRFEDEILHDCTKAGTTVQSVETPKLQRYTIPLPPTAEQQRIVTALEEHLSDLDAAVAGLQRALANTRRYRDAVRSAAARGLIFAGPSRMTSTPNDERDGGIPTGWRWVTIAECTAKEANAITDGPFGSKLKTAHYSESGPRVIRLQNIGDGEFVDARAHIPWEHFETLRKHEIFADDVAIAALGESLPRACIIPEQLGPAIVKADCIRFKPNPELLLPAYANIALNADVTRKSVTAMIHGVGRPRLNLSEIKSISIALPPVEQQRLIIAEVERRLAVADRAAAEIDVQFARTARLRRAILKRAFEGKLVPQDEHDEPVSTLLQRICAERAASNRKPHGSRSRRSARADVR